MNIADIVGPVDVFSAAVAIAFGGGATIMITTALARTPRRKLDLDFEVEKIRLENSDKASARDSDVNREVNLGKIIANKEVEVKRIENHMVDLNTVKSRGHSGGD